MVSEEIKNRKGAKKAQDIPDNVLKLLNEGKIPTVNLTEWLAINQVKLIQNTFQKIGLEESIDTITKAIELQKKPSTMSLIKLIGLHLYEYCKQSKTITSTISLLSNHESDTLRCYVTYLIALDSDLNISEKLNQSRKLIADKHFGVREIVWMALRPEIEKNLTESIKILSRWTSDSDENIRRFTTESTRPRGVWCKHIEELKENPEQMLPILEELKSDQSKYVQDSVGNWLNDASKSKPEFVIKLCKKWKSESPTAETEKIIKRALRTIMK
ncbi:DNA alkylation repair protein [Flavobacterium sp. 316]|uniref:DNA alkylation repair protein n=1 Tax=Flavobacterium sp. 316 TaxID=1603293 RepID=UPI0005E61BA3|nr:DNA alkylation repair protein [Flavobacterium sp. 316]KIX22205.1 DNA alkylation repair protein [Flavobacterium sp. 316]